MNRIEIDELNYQDYQHLDIVAYSFARGGAMGDPGGIKIVDSDGQVYHANYCYGRHTIKSEHIKAVIPVFEDLRISLTNCKTEKRQLAHHRPRIWQLSVCVEGHQRRFQP